MQRAGGFFSRQSNMERIIVKGLCTATKYMLMFIAASFIGWAYEVLCTYVLFHYWADRGVLHLPLCPIYGFGMMILYLIFRKVKSPGMIFLGSAVITTVIELGASYLLEYLFEARLWSYGGWPFTFDDRISLISSCIFGLMALMFMKLIVPLTERIYASWAKKYTAAFVVLLYAFCIIWEIVSGGPVPTT